MTRIDELRALAAKATPGPWEQGDWQGHCPDHEPGQHRPGQCRVVWEPWAYHEDHLIRGPEGPTVVAGNYGYEEGGIVRAEDTAFLVALRNNADALLDVAEAAAVLLPFLTALTENLGALYVNPAVIKGLPDLTAALRRLEEPA
jgi:hypothetical protein